MDKCIFCSIISGDLPSYKLYEDSLFIAILNIYPASRGHALIIPKRHTPDIFNLTDAEAKAQGLLALHLSKSIRDNLKPQGLNLLQNNGSCAGQEIFHFHLHLIPRYENDHVKISMAPLAQTPDILKETAELLKLKKVFS